LRIFVKLATLVTQNSSLSGIVRLDLRNLASFVVLVQETAAGVIVTTRDCFEEMTKSIPHNLNKHQAISLIWVIYKNGEDSGHLWTAHREKRMVKDMVPEFAVTERKAACTVALESTNRAYWEKDELTSILNRGVKFDYYFGSPGWLSITTHETALGPVKKDTTELAGHFRDLLTLKVPRALPKGMDFYGALLTVPPAYEFPVGTWHYDTTSEATSTPSTALGSHPEAFNRALSEEEDTAVRELLDRIYEGLAGLPVRSDMVQLLANRYNVALPTEVKEIVKAEMQFVKSKVEVPDHVKAERTDDGNLYDAVSGEFIVLE